MGVTQAIFFDVDGTLVDSNRLHVIAWDEVFREGGHIVPLAAIAGQIGKGGDNLVPALLPDIDPAQQQHLAERHGEVYTRRYMRQATPFPLARALLGRVRDSGRRVVLASSASAEEVDHYIALLDAAAIIDFTTSKDDVASSKPDPDIFSAALVKGGLLPEQAVVVGDTPYDVIAARGCGVAAVALLSGGFEANRLKDAGAVAVYGDVSDLLRGFTSSPLAR